MDFTMPFSGRMTDPFEEFKERTGNQQFRISRMTWAFFAVLVIVFGGSQLLMIGQDVLAVLRQLGESPGLLMVFLVTTVGLQWILFMLAYVAIWRERTSLAGLGLAKFKLIHVAWAVSFLLAANLILSGIAWLLAQVGLPMHGEVGLIVPKDLPGKMVWVVVSLTAGFCEEVIFRGYLMTRLRLIFKNKSWLVPTIVSAVAFGVVHDYQGLPGIIILTIYGAMFSLLYIRTGSLWPCVIAHSLQDLAALFYPH